MDHVLSGDSRVMQTITRYLEHLRGTIDGDELHGVISRTLRRHSRNGAPGPECLIDLHGQLEAFANDAIALPNMRIRARLLQQHIAPYISELRIETPVLQPATAAAEAAPPESVATPVEGVLERPREKEQAQTKQRAARYQRLLRSEKDAWQAIYGTVKDYQRLQAAWLKSLDELAAQRDSLESKLLKTTEQLSRLEVEHEKLRAELQSARNDPAKRPRATPRLLSRGGARATLAKRDGFLRTLEAEIKRIKRSGAPLALGLIGVENLDELMEHHGTEAASAALRCYAEEVLSNFRAYDVVGTFERDQFAVLFPDTPKDGARRALEKAYKRAAETHVSHSGRSIPLPPFAGVLVTYAAGEDPASLITRADAALQQARASGTRGVLPV